MSSPHDMTPDELRAVVARLGFAAGAAPNDEGLSALARFLGVEPRTVRAWTVRGAPGPAAVCLRLMLAKKIDAPTARKLLGMTDG